MDQSPASPPTTLARRRAVPQKPPLAGADRRRSEDLPHPAPLGLRPPGARRLWRFDDACAACGRLYGDLLGRDADVEGFRYAVDRLVSGQATPRDLVAEICTSEEFREKFLMNETANEFARRLILRLAREPWADPGQVKRLAVALLEGDWRVVIRGVIASDRYAATHGDDGIPIWV